MIFFKNFKLTFTPLESELEPVEPQDESDSGYLWREREGEPVVIDFNDDSCSFTLLPEDVDR